MSFRGSRLPSRSPASAGRRSGGISRRLVNRRLCGRRRFVRQPSYRSTAASLFRPSSSSTIRLMCL